MKNYHIEFGNIVEGQAHALYVQGRDPRDLDLMPHAIWLMKHFPGYVHSEDEVHDELAYAILYKYWELINLENKQ